MSEPENGSQKNSSTESIEHVRLNPTQKPTKRKTLPDHIILINGDTASYKCTACNKSFKSKSNCSYHKHCINSVDKPFECDICKKKFSSKSHLNYHTLIHTGSNPFKCTKCEKAFKTRNKLRRHELVHAEKSKDYSCDICGRRFVRKTSVKVHQRHHTGEKPYQCNDCPKAYREKKNLIYHIGSHTRTKNFKCDKCDKSYYLKWDLELHKRTHTRIRAFVCNFSDCQKSFKQNRYLKRHMETHRNAVKYLCSLCDDKEFSRKDNLQRHIQHTHMESDLNIASQNNNSEKFDTAPFIKTIHVNEKENGLIQPSTTRTFSVLKSVTSNGEIVEFQKDMSENQRTSVIMKNIDNNSTSQTNQIDDNSISTKINSDVDLLLVNERLNLNKQNDVNDENNHVYPKFTSCSGIKNDSSIMELSVHPNEHTKIKCFLPKKIISASYREHHIMDSDFDMMNKQPQEGYKLLDLSFSRINE